MSSIKDPELLPGDTNTGRVWAVEGIRSEGLGLGPSAPGYVLLSIMSALIPKSYDEFARYVAPQIAHRSAPSSRLGLLAFERVLHIEDQPRLYSHTCLIHDLISELVAPRTFQY